MFEMFWKKIKIHFEMKDTSYVLVQCPVPAADRQTSKFDISIMNKISLISST